MQARRVEPGEEDHGGVACCALQPATPACAATRQPPLSQALCLATATQQPTTSRHRRQREQIAAGRAGPRKARLQKDAAGRGGCRREARDGTSDSPRGALGTSYVRLRRAWGRQRAALALGA